MAGMEQAVRSAKRRFDDFERFVRDYAAGVNAQDLRRLFDHDAIQAYEILERDREAGAEPKDDLGRLWHRIKVVFLGLSYKLTPARRLLFVLAVLLALAGLFGLGPELISRGQVIFDASRLWFLLSVTCLGFLLTLELVDQIRVRDELEVARQLQRELLPTRAPELAGYSIAHAYRTANEVGGDYYDFSVLDDGRLALLVGDASGHGMGAGLVMAIANASIKLGIDLDPEPTQVMTLVNRSLCRTGDKRAFMSLFYGLLDPRSGELDYACAGHPFPLLRRRDGETTELGRGALPLGIREELRLEADSATLEEGDLLLLFSDGMPEALDRAETSFGYARIRSLVAEGGSAAEVRERLLRTLDSHLGGRPLADDFSLVVVQRQSHWAPPPPPPA